MDTVNVKQLQELVKYFRGRAKENLERSLKVERQEISWYRAKSDTYERCAEKLEEVAGVVRTHNA